MAIAQNTIFEMLRRQLEEPTISDATGGGSADANNNFSYDEKKDALKKSQNYLVNNLNKNYLSPLYKSISISGSSATLNTQDTLSPDDVLSVKVTYTEQGTSSSYYAKFTNIEELGKDLNNSYLKPTKEFPSVYLGPLSGNVDGKTKITIEPSTNVSSVLILAIGEPGELTDDNTSYYYLGEETLNALLYYAESELWRNDNRQQRSKIALEKCFNEIEILNNKYNTEL